MDLYILILIGILFLGQIVLFVLFFRFFKKLNTRFNGANGKTILKLLSDAMEKAEAVDKNLQDFYKEVKQDRKLLQTTLHKVGFLRFNPFKGMGGSHSFCIALLDADFNGFLITNLYGKDGARIYAKEIKGGASEQALNKEEEKTLQQAMKN